MPWGCQGRVWRWGWCRGGRTIRGGKQGGAETQGGDTQGGQPLVHRALFRFGRGFWCRLGSGPGGRGPRADFDDHRRSNVRDHLGQGIPTAVVFAVPVVVAGIVENRCLVSEDGNDVTGHFGDITAVIDRRAAIDPRTGGHDRVVSVVVDTLVDGGGMLGFAVLP